MDRGELRDEGRGGSSGDLGRSELYIYIWIYQKFFICTYPSSDVENGKLN